MRDLILAQRDGYQTQIGDPQPTCLVVGRSGLDLRAHFTETRSFSYPLKLGLRRFHFLDIAKHIISVAYPLHARTEIEEFRRQATKCDGNHKPNCAQD